jgi:hypothetical protein
LAGEEKEVKDSNGSKPNPPNKRAVFLFKFTFQKTVRSKQAMSASKASRKMKPNKPCSARFTGLTTMTTMMMGLTTMGTENQNGSWVLTGKRFHR